MGSRPSAISARASRSFHHPHEPSAVSGKATATPYRKQRFIDKYPHQNTGMFTPADEIKVDGFPQQDSDTLRDPTQPRRLTRFHIGGVQAAVQTPQRLAPLD